MTNLQERTCTLEGGESAPCNSSEVPKNSQVIVKAYPLDKIAATQSEECELTSSDSADFSEVADLRRQVQLLKMNNEGLVSEVERLNACCRMMVEGAQRCVQIESQKNMTDGFISNLQLRCTHYECEINFLKDQLNHICNLESRWRTILQQVTAMCDIKMQVSIKKEIRQLMNEDLVFVKKQYHSPYSAQSKRLSITTS